MKAAVLTIGSEIVDGYTINSNASYISKKLKDISIDTLNQTAITDDIDTITLELKRQLEIADIIIVTGGLGPTTDDLTREAIAEAYDIDYDTDTKQLAEFEQRYSKLNMKSPINNRKQFQYPKNDGFALANNVGVALGFIITKFPEKLIAVLPGVPKEMKPMFNLVLGEIQNRFEIKEKIYESVLKCFGAFESVIDSKIRHLCSPELDPQGAIQVKDSVITLRFKTKSSDEKIAREKLSKVTDEVKQILGEIVFGYACDELNEVVVETLADSGLRIGVAESCTAGLISYKIGQIPGVSTYFKQSVVAYSNQAKIDRLNVPENLIKEVGAVSPEVAVKMAQGLIETSKNIDIAISTTGIAGPDGATDEKPVGLVYIAITSKYNKDNGIVRKFNFKGDRTTIQERAALSALNLLRLFLIGKIHQD